MIKIKDFNQEIVLHQADLVGAVRHDGGDGAGQILPGDEGSVQHAKSFFDLEPSGVGFVFRLNFQGTLLPTQAFAKDKVEKKHGCILNISSSA